MNHNVPVATLVDVSNSAETETLSDEGNVFALLADQARDHDRSGLWMTAIGGAMNTALMWVSFPSIHWLASAFAATAAYGIWGLADRERDLINQDVRYAKFRYAALTTLRAVSIPAGVIAALAAVGGFMAVILNGLGRAG
jgi:hypothetical protein